MEINRETEILLREYADKYENADFLVGDPSWFMHQVSGDRNREAMAWMASVLSYGSRAQFLPKIQHLLDLSLGNPQEWLADGAYKTCFRPDDTTCFYRLYNRGLMYAFFEACRELILEYGSLGVFVEAHSHDALSAVDALCSYFSGKGLAVIVPKDAKSACKRVCMFLRWMVRSGSPVDLGLWSSFIDRRSLIMPLDTHVLTEAGKLGLVKSRNASMGAALKLTASMAQIFPEDPLKGDFALFGYGVNQSRD